MKIILQIFNQYVLIQRKWVYCHGKILGLMFCPPHREILDTGVKIREENCACVHVCLRDCFVFDSCLTLLIQCPHLYLSWNCISEEFSSWGKTGQQLFDLVLNTYKLNQLTKKSWIPVKKFQKNPWQYLVPEVT